MSTIAIGWAWKQTHLKPNQKYVLIACAEFAGMRGEGVYPGVPRLAAMTGYSERQVTRVLAELLDLGVMRLVQEGGWPKGGKPMATEYELLIYPSQVGDKLAPTPPCQSVGGSVTDCPEVGDDLSPQPRTSTKNLNQEHKDPAEAAPSSAAVDPIKAEAEKITATWWESLDPRPASGSYVGYRKVVERVLTAGWPAEAVAAATKTVGRTMTVARMELSLDKQRGRTVSYTAGPDTPAAVEINPAQW